MFSQPDPATPPKSPLGNPLSPPALGGLRLRRGEEDVRRLTPGGLLLRNLPLFLAIRREYGSLLTHAQPLAPSCSRLDSEKTSSPISLRLTSSLETSCF